MRLNIFRSRLITFLAPLVICLSVSVANSQDRPQTQQQPFRGGLNQVKDPDRSHPVRNDVAQPGDEIVTLRYFKIKKAASTSSYVSVWKACGLSLRSSAAE
jgi:hypothetical protein